MNWFGAYFNGVFVSWYVCPICGYDTRNERHYLTSSHTEPLEESEDKEQQNG